MFRQIRALIIKEFIAIWQDKKSRFVLIVPPLLQLLIFSHAATLDVNNISIGVWNRDSGQKSWELIQRIEGSPVFSHVIAIKSQQELNKKINLQELLIAIEIDDSFSRNILAGKPAKIQVIMDGRRSNSTQIAQGYLAKIVEQFNRENALGTDFEQPVTRLVQRNFFNPNLIYTWFTVPGLVCILTTVVTLTLTTMTIARERELGTFEQLLVSPLQPIQILIGKTIPAMVIGMVEGSIILAAAVTIFQIPFVGTLSLLYLTMFTYVLSIVGIGLFTSSVAKTQQQALLGVFLFMMPGVTLSGFATPIENMPEWLQIATYANPLRHFLFVVRGLFLKDIPAYVVFNSIFPLAIIATCTLSLATWFFRSRLE